MDPVGDNLVLVAVDATTADAVETLLSRAFPGTTTVTDDLPPSRKAIPCPPVLRRLRTVLATKYYSAPVEFVVVAASSLPAYVASVKSASRASAAGGDRRDNTEGDSAEAVLASRPIEKSSGSGSGLGSGDDDGGDGNNGDGDDCDGDADQTVTGDDVDEEETVWQGVILMISDLNSFSQVSPFLTTFVDNIFSAVSVVTGPLSPAIFHGDKVPSAESLLLTNECIRAVQDWSVDHRVEFVPMFQPTQVVDHFSTSSSSAHFVEDEDFGPRRLRSALECNYWLYMTVRQPSRSQISTNLIADPDRDDDRFDDDKTLPTDGDSDGSKNGPADPDQDSRLPEEWRSTYNPSESAADDEDRQSDYEEIPDGESILAGVGSVDSSGPAPSSSASASESVPSSSSEVDPSSGSTSTQSSEAGFRGTRPPLLPSSSLSAVLASISSPVGTGGGEFDDGAVEKMDEEWTKLLEQAQWLRRDGGTLPLAERQRRAAEVALSLMKLIDDEGNANDEDGSDSEEENESDS